MIALPAIAKRQGHRTPRYVFDRLSEIAYQLRHPEAPWLTPAMVDILDTWLRPADRGLEWGAGRSTGWLARRVGHVISIEENPDWGRRVGDMVDREGLGRRVELHVLPTGQGSGPTSVYVAKAAEIPAASLDFCLVDGDLRDYCASAALPLLKSGGILVVDNIERYVPRRIETRAPNARGAAEGYASDVWRQVMAEVAGWRLIWTSNGVSDTALWLKP
jgi:predicted O-methyltransferase YrrM